ncbi:MAG: hypothetical protein Q9209_007938 [Squamulea sp. 1 TL-2023]
MKNHGSINRLIQLDKEAKDKEVEQDGAKEFKDTNTVVKAQDSEGKESEHVKPTEEESEKPKKRQKVSANKDGGLTGRVFESPAAF